MATLKPDIDIIRGDSSSIDFTLTDNGSPVDLTGATVFFTAKPALSNDVSDNTAVISVEVTDHSDPTNGATVIPLSATDTDVTPGEYYYDIQVKKLDATIVSIRARKLEVFADVTRRTV
jgi:hypothetical protein